MGRVSGVVMHTGAWQCYHPGLPDGSGLLHWGKGLRRSPAADTNCAGSGTDHHLAEILPCSPQSNSCYVVLCLSDSWSLTCLKQFLPSMSTGVEKGIVWGCKALLSPLLFVISLSWEEGFSWRGRRRES